MMAESQAAKIASSWKSRKKQHEREDLKGLPKAVQDVVLEVEFWSHDIDRRVTLAEQIWEKDPSHPLALEPGNHPQTSWAQAFVEVGGECLIVTKESAEEPVVLEYAPHLTVGGQVDPAAELARALSVEPDEATKKRTEQLAREAAADQVRED